jgi:hypothetical protein
MKGQISIPTSTMMKALSFIIITVTIIGTLVAFQQYQITYESREKLKQMIDYGENFLNAKCLVYEEGTTFKHVLDKTKLDQNKNCIYIDKLVYVKIVDEKEGSWTFGSSVQSSEKLSFPLVIKYPNEYVAARMEVSI